MTDREKEHAARNRDIIARMGAPPTKAQILAELDLEISDALEFAIAVDLRALVQLLRRAKLEVRQVRRRAEFNDKS